jgi:hypothetical protein
LPEVLPDGIMDLRKREEKATNSAVKTRAGRRERSVGVWTLARTIRYWWLRSLRKIDISKPHTRRTTVLLPNGRPITISVFHEDEQYWAEFDPDPTAYVN